MQIHITNHTSLLVNQFYNELENYISAIDIPELQIILALNDLLEEHNEYEPDFINKSLKYLRENYGLTKSVWKVLLNLHQTVPNFAEKLSKWTDVSLIDYNGEIILNYYNNIKLYFPIIDNKLNNNNREYNIAKLFDMINLLCQHFSIEDSAKYVGLFIIEFDNKKSPFSINNLYAKSQWLKNNEAEDTITNTQINDFAHRFCFNHVLYNTLRALTLIYADYNDKTRKKHVDFMKNSLEPTFKRMNIVSDNVVETFNHMLYVYKKYTTEDFLTYQGLIEIKSKNIAQEDKEIIEILLNELEKSKFLNLTVSKIILESIKLVHAYDNNVVRAIEKKHDLNDYAYRYDHLPIITDLYLNGKCDLKNLLELSKKWEKKGESRGEKQNFKNYGIDKTLGDYTFYQIKNSHELYEEGKTQGHCVYIYSKSCFENNTVIISMRDLKGKKKSTIRIAKDSSISRFFNITNLLKNKKQSRSMWYLAENRKRFNKSCSDEEKRAAKEYFELIKSKLD